MSIITRADVVQCARDWIGTPFHHQARIKRVGVDCVGLVIGVARELGLVAAEFDITHYPRVPDATSLMRLAAVHLRALPSDVAMQPGDVVAVRFDSDPQHLGIVGDYAHGGRSIIHAASDAGRVIETRLMFGRHWMRFAAAYALPGVA